MITIENLRIIREKRGYSQLKVAMHVELSQEQISRYESGQSEPNLETLIKLAKYLNTSVDYLLEITNDDNPSNKRIKSDFTNEELEILRLYNNIISQDKEKTKKIMEIFASEKDLTTIS